MKVSANAVLAIAFVLWIAGVACFYAAKSAGILAHEDEVIAQFVVILIPFGWLFISMMFDSDIQDKGQ